jgi:hypothetical protein
MPTPSNSKEPPVLTKWRFVPNKKGSAGEVRYQWSDGSKTKETVASYVDAVSRLKAIQDIGGVKGK